MPLQAGGVEEGLTSMEHPQLCSHAIWAFPPPFPTKPGPSDTGSRAGIQIWGHVAAGLDLSLGWGRGQWQRQSRLRKPLGGA